MELLLSSVASCSAMDVLHILRKQKEPIEDLAIEIEGARVDAVPSPFVRMKMVFVARGRELDDHKLQRAVGLALQAFLERRRRRSTLGAGHLLRAGERHHQHLLLPCRETHRHARGQHPVLATD